MKILLEYDEVGGYITDKNGLSVCMLGMVGHEPEKPSDNRSLAEILETIRQGLNAQDLVTLKNSGAI